MSTNSTSIKNIIKESTESESGYIYKAVSPYTEITIELIDALAAQNEMLASDTQAVQRVRKTKPDEEPPLPIPGAIYPGDVVPQDVVDRAQAENEQASKELTIDNLTVIYHTVEFSGSRDAQFQIATSIQKLEDQPENDTLFQYTTTSRVFLTRVEFKELLNLITQEQEIILGE